MPIGSEKLNKGATASFCLALAGVLACYCTSDFLRENLAQAHHFILSPEFLFLCISGAILSWPLISGRRYDAAVFVIAALYSLVFYGRYLDPLRMAGDNICQIAYCKILFLPNLVGSTGAAFTKPGQMLVLGMLYQMSLYLGPYLFKVGLSLVMGACIWSLSRIATDMGGKGAGIAALLLAIWTFTGEFVEGSVSIFLIPCLFAGIRMYYYRPGQRPIGRLLLALTILFHIYTVAVLAVIWLSCLKERDWKELKVLSLQGCLSIGLWVALIYRVQGSLSRLNSGAAAGYVAPLEGTPANGLLYILQVVLDGFAQQPHFRTLVVLCVVGIGGAAAYGYARYLTIFASFAIMIVSVMFLGGTFNIERYCSTFYAFSCAIGIGTVARYAGDVCRLKCWSPKLLLLGTVLIAVVTLDFSGFNFRSAIESGAHDAYVAGHYVRSARNLMADPLLRTARRLLTEDDIVYSLIVMDPLRFESLAALQHFNVLGHAEREKMLATTDYVWISLTDDHPYYYLFHLVDPQWQHDEFRRLIVDMIGTNRPASLYGVTFIPVDRNSERMLLKVEPDVSSE